MGTVTLTPIERGVASGGLLQSAGAIPTSPSPWGGVTFTPDAGTASLWDCTSVGDKTFNVGEDPVRFDSYLAYSAYECYGRPVQDSLEVFSRFNLDRNMSRQVAVELQQSNQIASNPSLNSTATDITGGVATTLCSALAGLLSAVGMCGNVNMIIHAPRVALPALLGSNIATYDMSSKTYHIGGHLLIIDDYEQEGPGAVVATNNEAWLYATGPIEVAIGGTEIFSYYDNTQNTQMVIAEAPVIHRFDPSCVHAALFTLC